MQELSLHHRRIRDRGVNVPVYWIVRAVLQPLIYVYFRLARHGRLHIPRRGAVLLASNHRSFLNALGAFPVRRGESDEEAMETARAVLRRSDVVVIFPEGTRVRHGSLGRPK